MTRPHRHHPGYGAFVAHRVSGVLLALFLPAHFLVLALSAHLVAGLRLLVIELLPWRGPRHGLIGLGAGASLLAGALFLWSAF